MEILHVATIHSQCPSTSVCCTCTISSVAGIAVLISSHMHQYNYTYQAEYSSLLQMAMPQVVTKVIHRKRFCMVSEFRMYTATILSNRAVNRILVTVLLESIDQLMVVPKWWGFSKKTVTLV